MLAMYITYTHLKCAKECRLIETISKVCHNIISQCFSIGPLDANLLTMQVCVCVYVCAVCACVCVVNLQTTTAKETAINRDNSQGIRNRIQVLEMLSTEHKHKHQQHQQQQQ